jgi:hypothetical protein
MTAQVVVFRDNEFLLRVSVDRSQVCIGASITGDIVLEGGGMPDLAAVLVICGGNRYVLHDLTHGMIKLGGSPLQCEEAELAESETFELGRYQLRVESQANLSPLRSTARTPTCSRRGRRSR